MVDVNKQPKEIATLGVDDGGFIWTRPESEVSIFLGVYTPFEQFSQLIHWTQTSTTKCCASYKASEPAS